MNDNDFEDCDYEGNPIGEGMSSWMGDETNGGMDWKNENTSYMNDYTEEDIDRMLGNDDIYGMNSPKTKPSEKPDTPTVDPDVKPGRRVRPNPFSPPDRDTEPAPAKAGRRDRGPVGYDDDVEFS